MVFVTGDCHAQFHKFSTDAFPQQKDLTKDDIVIVCGDFGIWHDGAEERWWLDWLDKKPFTTVFVDGNHENFDRLYSGEFPTVTFRGGKAHRIRSSVFHLMRGNVFNFEGRKFFCFGGAQSHDVEDGILDRADFPSDEAFGDRIRQMRRADRRFRVNHVSWWEQELPSQEELASGLQALILNDNRVDFIITHCCPQEIASVCGFREADRLTSWFNMVAHTVQFDRWYFGHYHDDKQIMSKFIMLYHRIERIL